MLTYLFNSSFSISTLTWSNILDLAIKVGIVVITFFVFRIVIKLTLKAIDKVLLKKQIKGIFHNFIISIIKVVVYIILILTLLGAFEIDTTPLLAVLGTFGLALGLALKDHMANLASGILIVVNKQFALGDYIGCEGVDGTVVKLELFNTKLKTLDNKIVYIPNSNFTKNAIINYTKESTRRVDVSIGVSYNTKIADVKKAIDNIIEKNNKILKEPESFVGLVEFGDSSINFVVRVWTETINYWEVYFYINEAIKVQFDKQNIEIPYPQLDIHMNKEK